MVGWLQGRSRMVEGRGGRKGAQSLVASKQRQKAWPRTHPSTPQQVASHQTLPAKGTFSYWTQQWMNALMRRASPWLSHLSNTWDFVGTSRSKLPQGRSEKHKDLLSAALLVEPGFSSPKDFKSVLFFLCTPFFQRWKNQWMLSISS